MQLSRLIFIPLIFSALLDGMANAQDWPDLNHYRQANNIKIILASILPAQSFSWKPDLRPAADILALNQLIQSYSRSEGLVFLDYHSAMVNDQNGLAKSLTKDGVHPNRAGYEIMEALAEEALAKAKR